MFDILYTGSKPNLFPHEKPALSLDHAKLLSRTKFFWVINGDNDNSDFDFTWHPVIWEEHQTHVFTCASQFGEKFEIRFCPKHTIELVEHYYDTQYLERHNNPEYWAVPENIDTTTFNFKWCPSPYEKNYKFVFGTQWQRSGGPVYKIPGAAHSKYVDEARALALPTSSNWRVPANIDKNKFMFSWHPDTDEPPYIYKFGTQWQRSGGPEYHVPGATEIKYIDHPMATATQDLSQWEVLIPTTSFDFSWHPDTDGPPYIYIFGNQWNPAVIEPTLRYVVPGATQEKFIDDIIATVAVDMEPWEVIIPVDNFDYSWRPNPKDPPYIYVFGNQWNPAVIEPTLTYSVAGATQVKYVDEIIATVSHDKTNWSASLAIENFDYSWRPNPKDPEYIYVFGNQWNPGVLEETIRYTVGNATQIKYVNDIAATVAPTVENWITIEDIEQFDYSWRPNPTDPPYIYVFGNQWNPPEVKASLEYHVPGAVDRKYVPEPTAIKGAGKDKFVTLINCEFDYSWEPHPGDPPFIYVFGNQWYPPEVMPTVEYRVDGATEIKYVDSPTAKLLPVMNNWVVPNKKLSFEFDYSWVPHPGDPEPYIYVFGNQWYASEIMPTVEYHVTEATERKFIAETIAKLLPDRTNWSIPEEVIQDNIDFSWVPHPKDQSYIYHFGSDFQMSIGLTYSVPGAIELKFAGDAPTISTEVKVVQTLSIFFVDMNNKSSAKRYELLQARYPSIQKIRFMNGWVETIKRCLTRSATQKFWIISSENVYDNFNFEWHAQPWQNFMTHVFASQWQKWSDTFLINKREFERHIKWAKTIEEFPNLNFVKDQPVYRPDDIYDIYYIDHFNPGSQANLERIQRRYPDIRTARYVDNYLDTLKRVVTTVETEYVWVTNSTCDYSKFDFTWQPEPWQATMLHVFPSDDQKFGDTFYVHVPSFKSQMAKLELLDWFDTVNYCNEQTVPRLPSDIICYNSDSVVDAIKAHEFTGPYAWFKHTSVKQAIPKFTPPNWRKRDRVVHTFTQSGSTILVPREAKAFLDTQMYDYPYIMPHKELFLDEKPQDIVFISYDEPQADTNYAKLKEKFPRAMRLHGVEGMENALLAAANLSTTPWYYAVFAKTEIADTFMFDYMPDFMQQPKHYIFHAKNPLNGLEYGHMGVVLYNCGIIRNTTTFGIDYTMSSEHEVVTQVSAIATFNVSPYQTWRTAFREGAKLCQFIDEKNEQITIDRLNTWVTKAEGEYAEWCVQGARDGVEFYKLHKNDNAYLKQAFDWKWLKMHFASLYSDVDSPSPAMLALRQLQWQH
jgi:hypothetical protein